METNCIKKYITVYNSNNCFKIEKRKKESKKERNKERKLLGPTFQFLRELILNLSEVAYMIYDSKEQNKTKQTKTNVVSLHTQEDFILSFLIKEKLLSR